ncbi:MAG TPA: pilus assembly protein TadG-related protein, partial [Gemmataceae bacterium]|nr:pilus assembly protein TadG-related protein [Gemmataceae bacterium]
MKQRSDRRAGSILPLVVICLIALMGMVALAIDVGLVAVARTQAQDAADAAALAGARMLSGDTSSASNLNNVNTAVTSAQTAATNNSLLGRAVAASAVNTQAGIYTYDTASKQFVASFPNAPGANAWSVMKVTINTTTPTYFGRVFNINSFNISATA